MSGAVRQRLNQLDALRGLAAMAVVLFHFSTRFSELYPQAAPQAWSVPLGYVGVNLFFIISGFVIFMTVERTARPADFVVSRISRLYPAYWVAIILTFCITHDAGLQLLESPLSKDQQVTPVEGGYEIKATLVETEQLKWWLRGFGEQVWGIEQRPVTAPNLSK